MAEKNFKSRIVHKHDTAENWEKATGFIPMQGEIIIYDIDASYDYERIKIGDGATIVDELPFANDALKAELMQSDWLQADNTQLDYIKNKPEIVSDEEFFNWIIEEKIVEPIASTNGEIYITNNNEIYVL